MRQAEVRFRSFLTSAPDGQWSVSRPGRFVPEKERRYPLTEKSGGLYSRSGRFGEKSLGSARNRIPNCPANRLVTLPTEPTRLFIRANAGFASLRFVGFLRQAQKPHNWNNETQQMCKV